jgi:hypothetical protein
VVTHCRKEPVRPCNHSTDCWQPSSAQSAVRLQFCWSALLKCSQTEIFLKQKPRQTLCIHSNTCYHHQLAGSFKFLASLRNISASHICTVFTHCTVFMTYKTSKHKTDSLSLSLSLVASNSGYLCHQFNGLRVTDSALENCFFYIRQRCCGFWLHGARDHLKSHGRVNLESHVLGDTN